MRPTPGEWNRAEEAIRMTDATGKLSEGRPVFEVRENGVWNNRTESVMWVMQYDLEAKRLAAYLNEAVEKYIAKDDEVEALRTENEALSRRRYQLHMAWQNAHLLWARAEAENAALKAKAALASGLTRILRVTHDHIRELEDAWQRGALHETDGLGGYRSNRNAEIRVALAEAIALTDPPKGDHTPEGD